MSEHANNGDIEYDAESGIYRTTYDIARESLSVRVLEAVAAIRNTDPTDLDPLDEYIDPDSLNSIFEPTATKSGTHGSLSFAYEGLLVIIHSDGEVELREEV